VAAESDVPTNTPDLTHDLHSNLAAKVYNTEEFFPLELELAMKYSILIQNKKETKEIFIYLLVKI